MGVETQALVTSVFIAIIKQRKLFLTHPSNVLLLILSRIFLPSLFLLCSPPLASHTLILRLVSAYVIVMLYRYP